MTYAADDADTADVVAEVVDIGRKRSLHFVSGV